MSRCLSIEDVRMFMLDRSAEDNALDMDLSFSNEEITEAMRRAARETNDMPPYTAQVNPDCLPGDSNIWLHAVAEQLCVAKLANLARNDVQYNADGVSASDTANRIQHFQGLIKLHRSIWEDRLQHLKVRNNMRRMHMYGC